jgi:hypothetical protein
LQAAEDIVGIRHGPTVPVQPESYLPDSHSRHRPAPRLSRLDIHANPVPISLIMEICRLANRDSGSTSRNCKIFRHWLWLKQ